MFITEASAASSQAVEHENAVLTHVFQFLISDIWSVMMMIFSRLIQLSETGNN